VYTHPEIHSQLARQRQADVQRWVRPRSRRPQPTARRPLDDLGRLVEAAKAGDHEAWELLVTHFTPKLRSVVRGYRLNEADVDDVVQATWTAALTHVDRIRVPHAFARWLLVTARHASLRVLERSRREVVGNDELLPSDLTAGTPEKALLEDEFRVAVHAALERLPERQGTIVRALLLNSGTSYADLAGKLGIPIGSIGPTRERALARLRREIAAI
jgi:RNA polymerase sigma factor (sigma-70 family)